MFAIEKNRNGAVERPAIIPHYNDLAKGAGEADVLAHKGNFASFPHLTAPEWLGLAATLSLSLFTILIAIALHPDRHTHACARPTSAPATWSGECGTAAFGGERQ